MNNDDAPLMLALQVIGKQQSQLRDLHSSLYQTEQNLAEQERLTEQARRWAVTLEAELRQVSEDLSL